MQKDTSKILTKLEIEHSVEKWVNRKYNKTYYSIHIKKNRIDNFLNILPLRNFEKLGRIIMKFNTREYQSGQMGQAQGIKN